MAMKKYKIGNHLIIADSPQEAVKLLKSMSKTQIVDTNDRDVLIIALRETAKDLEAQRIDVNGAKKQIRAYL